MNFINKLYKFMYGRYGVDDIYKFLFKLYIFLIFLNLFINSRIIFILELLVMVIMFYRFFSKKTYIRSNENKKFLKIKNKIIKPFKNIKRNIIDKEHIYKKCHKCKRTLKFPLPSKKGIKHAKCPYCGKKITILTFKYEKIEIIKNGKSVKLKKG